MAQTNGIDFPRVKEALFGRLGWRASTVPGAVVVSDENKRADSGRYFNEAHALCTVENIKALLDNPKATAEQVNAELEILQTGVIMEGLAAVLNEPEILERGADFLRGDDEQNDVPQPGGGRFVGRRIAIAQIEDLGARIDAVNLYFDKAIELPLYLFRQGQNTPVKTQTVATAAGERTRVKLGGFEMRPESGIHYGGAYLFGYFESDLAGAVAMDETRREWSANLWGMEFIQAPALEAAKFDRKRVSSSSHSHGLNIELTAFRDWTAAIEKSPGIFDNLVSLLMAAKVVEKALHTIRSNSTERILKEQLVSLGYMDLTGAFPAPDGPKIQGLKQKIEKEAARVKKSFHQAPRAITYSPAC